MRHLASLARAQSPPPPPPECANAASASGDSSYPSSPGGSSTAGSAPDNIPGSRPSSQPSASPSAPAGSPPAPLPSGRRAPSPASPTPPSPWGVTAHGGPYMYSSSTAAGGIGSPLHIGQQRSAAAVAAEERRRRQLLRQHPCLGVLEAGRAKVTNLRLYLDNPDFTALKPLGSLSHLLELSLLVRHLTLPAPGPLVHTV